MKWKAIDIARLTGGNIPDPFGGTEIAGVTADPKAVQTGFLFVPLEDDAHDGHLSAEEAISLGAAAILWRDGHPAAAPEQFPVIRVNDTREALMELAREYRNQLPVRTMAVTGSVGKTTTIDMLVTVLATTYRVHQGGASEHPLSDLALSILRMTEDTEMAVFELQWSPKADLAVQSQLLAPEAVIITNIGETHLARFGNRRQLAYAMAGIVSGMKPGGLLVYNGEEPLLEEALGDVEKPEGLLTYRFGTDDANDLFPIAMLNEPDGTSFKTNLPATTYYRIPLLGLHNIINALGAVAVSKYMGVLDQDVADGTSKLARSYTRLVPIRTRSGAVILNDSFSASPTSMKAAIELLKDIPGYERKMVVLGDMVELGPDEVQFHKEIGSLLKAPDIYKVFTYGTLAKHIASEASKGLPGGRVRWFQEKAELIDAVAAEARERDAILVKGSRMMGLDELVEILTGA